MGGDYSDTTMAAQGTPASAARHSPITEAGDECVPFSETDFRRALKHYFSGDSRHDLQRNISSVRRERMGLNEFHGSH